MGAPGYRPGVVYNRKNKGGTVRISLRELAYASVVVASLAAAGHFMGRNAEAQSAGGRDIVAVTTDAYASFNWVYLANGDVVRVRISGNFDAATVGNIFTAAPPPTAVQPQTWSQIKAAHGGR